MVAALKHFNLKTGQAIFDKHLPHLKKEGKNKSCLTFFVNNLNPSPSPVEKGVKVLSCREDLGEVFRPPQELLENQNKLFY